MKPTLPILSTCVLLSLQACMVASVQSNALSDTPGFGSQPVLPEPEQKLLPTIHIAKAIGWEQGDKPRAADGLLVSAYA